MTLPNATYYNNCTGACANKDGIRQPMSKKVFIQTPDCPSMAKKNDSGFQSSAGLMRYFDTENEKGVRIGPKTVIGIAIGLIVVVLLANTLVPL